MGDLLVIIGVIGLSDGGWCLGVARITLDPLNSPKGIIFHQLTIIRLLVIIIVYY